MSDAYLREVLALHAVDTGPDSAVRQVQGVLEPTIYRWGGGQILSVDPSGSFAKGTAIRSGTDIDLFVSLSSTTGETLATIYQTLFNALDGAGFQPRRQNVSIGMRIGPYDVDVVPGRRQSSYGNDHWLYSTKRDSHLQTNVARHIADVSRSGRADEIRLLKIWRNRKGLSFPSFYLELAAIRALHGRWTGNLSSNVVVALEFLRDRFEGARFVDPSNSNNVISDELASAEKRAIAGAARATLQSSWEAEFA